MSDVLEQSNIAFEAQVPLDLQEETNKDLGSTIEDLEFPQATILKILKETFPENVRFSKDTRQTIGRAATVFVSYVGAMAQEVALKGKRKRIGATDILTALDMLDFSDLILPLAENLEGYNETVQANKLKRAEATIRIENEPALGRMGDESS